MDTEDISPCRRLLRFADRGDAEGLDQEVRKLQASRGRDEVARDIVTCDFGKRNSLSSLHSAAMHGHADSLRVLLEANGDANATDDSGNTALHFAAELGHAKAVHLLLLFGGDKQARNNFGRSPLEKSSVNTWDTSQCKAGKTRIRYLFDGGSWEDLPPEEAPPAAAEPPRQPARPAPSVGLPWLSAVAEELGIEGDIPRDLPHLFAMPGQRASASRTVHVPGNQYASSEISTAATLQDVDIDTGHPPSLTELVRSENLPALRSKLSELQEQGSIRAVIAEVTNIDGTADDSRAAMSPLHAAATTGHLEILQVLLATRADPNISDDAGNTLLHAAAGMGHDAVVGALLEAGADPGWRNNFGRSPRAHAQPQSWESEETQERKALVCQRLQTHAQAQASV